MIRLLSQPHDKVLTFEEFTKNFEREMKEKQALVLLSREYNQTRQNAINYLTRAHLPEFSKFVEFFKLEPQGCCNCGKAHLTSYFMNDYEQDRWYKCTSSISRLDYIEVKYETNFGYYLVDGIKIATVLWYNVICYDKKIHKRQTLFLIWAIEKMCKQQFHGPCKFITQTAIEYIGYRWWICLKD